MIDPELAGVQIEHKVEEAPATTTKREMCIRDRDKSKTLSSNKM